MNEAETIWLGFSIGHPWALGSTLTRTLTQCHLGHVCFGDQRGMFDPAYSGDRLHEWDWFLERYPTLQTVVQIPVPRAIDPRAFPLDKRKISIPRGLVYFFSRGRITSRNCMTRTREYLATCGLVLPRSVISPRDLYEDSHRRKAHECVIDAAHAVYCRSAGIACKLAAPEVPAGHGGTPERLGETE